MSAKFGVLSALLAVLWVGACSGDEPDDWCFSGKYGCEGPFRHGDSYTCHGDTVSSCPANPTQFWVCSERLNGCQCQLEWAASQPPSIACDQDSVASGICCAHNDYPDDQITSCECGVTSCYDSEVTDCVTTEPADETTGGSSAGGMTHSAGSSGVAGDGGVGGAAESVDAGPQECGYVLHSGACGNCERATCCDELGACYDDTTCRSCWSGTVGSSCIENGAFVALIKCSIGPQAPCVEVCKAPPGATPRSSASDSVECTSNSDCYGCARCSDNKCRFCVTGPYGCTC